MKRELIYDLLRLALSEDKAEVGAFAGVDDAAVTGIN